MSADSPDLPDAPLSHPASLPNSGTVTSFRNTLPEGHRVDAWRIDRVVATSATAVIYAATDVQLGTVVALKEYMPARLARRDESGRVVPVDEAAFERGLGAFVATARLLSLCREPALVAVFGVSLAHGTAYQAMPWIEGTSLRDLRAGMPGPPDETALRALLDNLLAALAAIHATGRIHGDVNPAKVLLQRDDQAVLLGPGSAAREGAAVEKGAPGAYTAPEQSGQGGAGVPGPWTDLYALAAVARFCMAGAGGTAVGDAPPARYSAALLSTIERALSPQVAARPQSVAEFRAALAGTARSADTAPEAEMALDAERARIKRVVDSINFDDDDEEPPRADGRASRPASLSVAAAAGPAPVTGRASGAAPVARPLRWRAGAIAGVALLGAIGAIGAWALLRSPAPGGVSLPAQVAAATGGLASAPPLADAASRPASSAKPSVEDSLAVAAAVLGAASDPALAPALDSAPMPDSAVTPADVSASGSASATALASASSTAPAPVPASARASAPSPSASALASAPAPSPASAPLLAGLPATAAPAAASAAATSAQPVTPAASAPVNSRQAKLQAAKPQPTKRSTAATATATATRKPAANPRTACAGRGDFALYRCMKTQCAQARWTAHPQCVRLRKTDRVDG